MLWSVRLGIKWTQEKKRMLTTVFFEIESVQERGTYGKRGCLKGMRVKFNTTWQCVPRAPIWLFRRITIQIRPVNNLLHSGWRYWTEWCSKSATLHWARRCINNASMVDKINETGPSDYLKVNSSLGQVLTALPEIRRLVQREGYQFVENFCTQPYEGCLRVLGRSKRQFQWWLKCASWCQSFSATWNWK